MAPSYWLQVHTQLVDAFSGKGPFTLNDVVKHLSLTEAGLTARIRELRYFGYIVTWTSGRRGERGTYKIEVAP